jgi:hypothetical protein
MPERWDRADPDRFAPLEALLALARHPNVAVKWGHLTKLSALRFPYDDVLAQLRRVLDAFGAQRVMWESDWTQCAGAETLAEMLFAVRVSPRFSDEEKAWLLGRTAQTVMRWDRSDDRIDVVAVAEQDWDGFLAALATQGRLPNARVRVVRMALGQAVAWPDGARRVSTAPIAGTESVSVTQAASVAVSGRIEHCA